MLGALEGIKVLDFSTLLPGPLASLFLVEAGAEVIKVERPVSGEEMRSYVPKWGADSVNFAMLNRGKKSLEIDLKDPSSRDILVPLIQDADILIEQFRPGVMARLGLSYEDVRELNSNIIYCSITSYGQTGPKASLAGHDLNFVGSTGLLAFSHGAPESPVLPPALIADIAGGTYPALLNILLALRARDAGKGGDYLDIAMAENLFPFTYWAMGEGQVGDKWPENGNALVTGGSPRYQLYETADGRMLAAAPIEQKFWDVFCDTIGLELKLRGDAADPHLTRTAIASIIASKTTEHWIATLVEADCCCSIVQSLSEAIHDEHFVARSVFTRQLSADGENNITALPIPLTKSLAVGFNVNDRVPALGSDNVELTKRAKALWHRPEGKKI